MNNIKILVWGLVVMTMAACQKEEYKLEIPESGVTLSLPAEGDILDLNKEGITSFQFNCNSVCEGGNTLILSASPMLKDQLPIKTVTVDMGDKTSLEMDVLDADIYFSSLGIGGGKTGTLYWTVKPTKDLTVAATEIRSFTTRRIQTQLIIPEDQAVVVLNADTPDEEVAFAWQVEKEVPGTEYQLCFGMDSRMEKENVVLDAGNTGECKLTHQQLQDIIKQLPITPYSQNNIYWNVQRKSDNSFISRTSHILKLNDMLIFTDIRGDEKITYRVTKIKYSSGEEVIWLAENLRATKYPDGSELSIESGERWAAPTDVPVGHQKAYGCYYSVSIGDKIVPAGWRLPSSDDYQALMSEAKRSRGTADVLKHPVYWNWKSGPTDLANALGFNMSACGVVQWDDGNLSLYNGAAGDCTCFFLASGLEHKAVMINDYGCSVGEVYNSECWGGAAVRLIYVGK